MKVFERNMREKRIQMQPVRTRKALKKTECETHTQKKKQIDKRPSLRHRLKTAIVVNKTVID